MISRTIFQRLQIALVFQTRACFSQIALKTKLKLKNYYTYTYNTLQQIHVY
jgi:hypothetical protein